MSVTSTSAGPRAGVVVGGKAHPVGAGVQDGEEVAGLVDGGEEAVAGEEVAGFADWADDVYRSGFCRRAGGWEGSGGGPGRGPGG